MKTKLFLGLSLAALTSFAHAGATAIPSSIMFDGYCDGMTFSSAGGGFITGSSIGCLADPLHGVDAKVKKQGPSYVVTAYGVTLGGMGLTFIINENGTWYIERADGSGTFVNSGTWTDASTARRAPEGAKAAGMK
jgi:hypothetical protein